MLLSDALKSVFSIIDRGHGALIRETALVTFATWIESAGRLRVR